VRLRVEALGGLAVSTRGTALSIAGSCRPILGYLLTHRRRRISRAELAETLWAEHDGNHARRCLSTALWRLKKSTGTGAPLVTFQGAEEVSFNWLAPAWVDCVAMELRVESLLRVRPQALSRREIGSLQRGVRLYRGDYLVGIDHEWAWLERQRLRNLYLDGLYHLTLAHAVASDWPSVLECGRRLSRDEPLREDVHRLLMRAHAQTGNRALAIAQYQLCRDALRTELGVDPMPETQELYATLAAGQEPSGAPVAPLSARVAPRSARERLARVRRVLALSHKELDHVLAQLGEPQASRTDS
jgi:DNA-binding SARP family transcriptional activator